MHVFRSSLLACATLAIVATARADTCPAVDEAAVEGRLDPIFDRLRGSTDEDTGMLAASEIWQIFATAPNAHAQDLLDKGMQRIRWGSFGDAEAALTLLVDYCPDYAEGWNQRAFARFLANDFDGAMADLDRALALQPRHFGAIAGRGLTFLAQGDKLQGYQALREAVDVHPWLTERHLLPPEERT